jgi:hypothetical protein
MDNLIDSIAMRLQLGIHDLEEADKEVRRVAKRVQEEAARVVEYVDDQLSTGDSFSYGEHLTESLRRRKMAIEQLKLTLSFARQTDASAGEMVDQPKWNELVGTAHDILGIEPKQQATKSRAVTQ